MKLKTLMCAAGVIALLFAGCAQPQSQTRYIGAESAKQTALEAAALTEQEVSSINTDMGTRDGLDYYQVRFEAAGQSYQYEIDALTGVVISAEGSASTAGGQTDQPGPDITQGPDDQNPGPDITEGSGDQNPGPDITQGTGDQVPGPEIPQGSGGQAPGPGIAQGPGSPASDASSFSQTLEPAAPPASASASNAYIGEAEARRAALEHAGLEESQVTFASSLLEFDDGQWEYDVEFYTANYEEYDYEIDAFTGAVISFDYDAEYYSPPGGSSAITNEQARQIALAQVPGAAERDIREFELDSDDGILLYEGKIIYNGMEYEFEIDAYSGAIREWSAEPFAR